MYPAVNSQPYYWDPNYQAYVNIPPQVVPFHQAQQTNIETYPQVIQHKPLVQQPQVIQTGRMDKYETVQICQLLLIVGTILFFFAGIIPGLFIWTAGGIYALITRNRRYAVAMFSVPTLITLLVIGITTLPFIFSFFVINQSQMV